MRTSQVNCEKFLSLYKQNYSDGRIAKVLGCGSSAIQRCRTKLKLPPVKDPRTKQEMSTKKKEWLKNNPDKHPWRNKNKFKSPPCEKVKEFLTKLNVQFIPEFQPQIQDRYFSIDIAIPDKMIALEVNGNQHYEHDGSLKPYYQERHNLLEFAGWDVYEIHYSACFNLPKWVEFFNKIKNSEKKIDFNYFTYVPRKKWNEKDKCPNCDKLKGARSNLCRTCRDENRKINSKHFNISPKNLKKKVPASKEDFCPKCGGIKKIKSKICQSCQFPCVWPTPEEMKILIWEKPTTKIALQLGVSDKAVEKFCKNNKIDKPARGYWVKIGTGDRT